MRKAKCLLCGEWFVQYRPQDHTCPSCEGEIDEHDEREAKKREEEP